MFVLGIRYLNGFVTASHGNYQQVEWPPHPARLFMALVAAHHQTGADPAEREALLWLEGLPEPPEIYAGSAFGRTGFTHFVPVNDKAGPSKALMHSLAMTRDRQARTFARAWLEDDMVFCVWPNAAEPSQAVRQALTGLCAKVTRVGHSSSLVQVWLADEVAAGLSRWVPDPERATHSFRVIAIDTLSELERTFGGERIAEYERLMFAVEDATTKKARAAAVKRLNENFPDGPPVPKRPSLSAYHGYSQAGKTEDVPSALPTVFSPHLVVFTLERKSGPYRQLDLLCTLALTDRWRAALIRQSNDLSAEARSILSGHTRQGEPLERPHLAFSTLGFVGHPNADGHLTGVALALPADLSGEVRTELLSTASRLSNLVLGRLGEWALVQLTTTGASATLRAATWTGYPEGAIQWSSVTPVAFDHHPKAKDKRPYAQEAAEMICASCERIGLPRPVNVVITTVSAHLGAPPSFAFSRLRRKDGSERRHTHAILAFDEPVYGPILIGAGRYRGYGLFRPLEMSV
jgi:CRISPR-associated protein Csb2